MPQLTKKDYRFQYNQFTMWGHVANMLDENDPLREKAMERYGYEAFVNNNAEDSGVFTGTSDIYDEKGKLHKNVPNSKIMEGGTVGRPGEQFLLDTTDPGYIKYQQDGLKLAADIRKKYQGRPDCEMLFAFLDIIETNKTSVMGENHGYENTPHRTVISNSRKMMDVIFDTPGGPKDAKTCREVAKEFALNKLYSAYNDVAKLGVEHANEWAGGEPDPEKLRQIKARSDDAVNRFENAVIEFRDRHNADLKKPEKERRLYDLTKKQNIDDQEMIGKGGRAIDTKQPLMRIEYETKFKNEILAAELMKARRETGFDKNISKNKKEKNLRKLTNSLIDDLTRHRNPAIRDDTPLSDKERETRMQKLGEAARKLAGNPMADRIREIMSRDLLKVNTEVTSSVSSEQPKENKVPEVKNVDIGTISTGPKNDNNIIRNENNIIQNDNNNILNEDNIIQNDSNIIRNDDNIIIETGSQKDQINEINEPKKEENIIIQDDDNIIIETGSRKDQINESCNFILMSL